MLYRTFQKWVCSFEECITLGNTGVPEGISSFTKNLFTVEMYGCNIWPIWWEVRCNRIRACHEWCPCLHQPHTGLCPHMEICCEMFDDIYIVWHPPFHAVPLIDCLFWCGDVEFCQTWQVWYLTHLQIMLICIYFWESALVTPTKQWGSMEWGTQTCMYLIHAHFWMWIAHLGRWVVPIHRQRYQKRKS